jgi:hypothetical protein
MKIVLLILAALLTPQSATDTGNLADRRAVYRAVLRDARCRGSGRPGVKGDRPVLLRAVVNPIEQAWWQYAPAPSLAERLPKMIPGLRAELLQEYLRINAPRSLFTEDDARELGADLVSRAELDQMGKTVWIWTAFYQRFPSATALVELSVPVIDRAAGEALVYCGESTGSLAGRGFLILLRNGSAGWVPVFWQELWVS